jgi:hypothetical protein
VSLPHGGLFLFLVGPFVLFSFESLLFYLLIKNKK